MWAEAPVPDYLKATVATVVDIHATKGAGDVLVFLTGQDEVRSGCCARVRSGCCAAGVAQGARPGLIWVRVRWTAPCR